MLDPAEYYPTKAIRTEWRDGLLEFHSENHVILRIQVLTDHIIRVRYATQGYFMDDFSYGIDPDFRVRFDQAEFTETENDYIITTKALVCRVDKMTLHLGFYDPDGNLINKDEKGFHWQENDDLGNDIVKMTKVAQPGEVYFGLGDKPCSLNMRGKRLSNWGTDSYGYELDWDPLYKNIPFYYGLHNRSGYGIFFDNSFYTFFDFASERKEVTSFWAHGGEMNYYFIAGPQIIDVAKRYTDLTGKPELPPMWALGFQQCKWSYYPEAEVRSLAIKMRAHRIPCDAIYLDIDYMDGFRCFTWDLDRFPDPKRMIDELKKDGFQTVVIIDPGIKKDYRYSVFLEALENDYFCRRPDGPYVEGLVWPGECYFPDFTRPEVREWWAGLFKDLIADKGVAGVWNDMNEPAMFEVETKTFPEDSRHDYDGHPCSHRKAHNVYGMQMARATNEGIKKYSKNRRGLVISRSGYSGLQRFSSVWTGDNRATWQHIWIANIQCQRLSISGVSFTGSDIGGFIGQPSPEMFIRWIQLGIFHPFCRVHSSQDDGDQEPWSFGKMALDRFREAVEMRYRMLPYHYTAFYQCCTSGTPVLRPLSFVAQDEEQTWFRDSEFLVGDHMLTAEVSSEGLEKMEIYLPHGEWYNFWDAIIYHGKRLIEYPISLERFPLFIRAGAIIPFYPVQQYVDQKKFEAVSLHIYFKEGNEASVFYDDAHDGYEYKVGQYRLCQFHLEGSPDELVITQNSMGDFIPGYVYYDLEFFGLPFSKYRLEIDGIIQNDDTKRVSIHFNTLVVRSWMGF